MHIPSPIARRKARIEIIPLIDIMFFLLATFLMVSLSMVQNSGIPVRLPAAKTGQTHDRGETACLSIARDGVIYFNHEPLSMETLPERLRTFKAAYVDGRIVLNNDRDASWGRAVAILDWARECGITRVVIQTCPEKP
ncbi:MAG: biopolymer transporter ExbD [Verrucomicrobiae bacterium]|nr:biopolymer transporter ExbD [Verrucomicrobiae bacterium]MDD2709111.1 biopolymer transporter ExbD [Verrucomicrobiae bacterium]